MYKILLKPLLFSMDAESAHDLAMSAGELVSSSHLLQDLTKSIYGFEHSNLERNFWGINFKNPIGLAAGFDKNARIINGIAALGFGFTEIGSITAQSSKGNPKPRAFRLPEDDSLINRMGLNNEGAEKIISRLIGTDFPIPLGVNIAKTHNPAILGDKAIQDYVISFEEAEKVADYITINISCPNTEEGKTFEDSEALSALLEAIQPTSRSLPVLVKFSVDLELELLSELTEICENFGIQGYVVTNTSSKRDQLKSSSKLIQSIGRGGLSGASISEKSTQIVHWLRNEIKTSHPIIGVGGINSVDEAKRKLDAGADLLQIYTGLVYEGPGLVQQLKKGLIDYSVAERSNVTSHSTGIASS